MENLYIKENETHELMYQMEDGKFIDYLDDSMLDAKNIILDDSVTKIPDYAFVDMLSLKTVVASPSSELESIGEGAFQNTNIEKIGLPSASKISAKAFFHCGNLQEVHAPNVKEIGDASFMNCCSLKKFDMPKLKNIGDYALGGCQNLKSVNLSQIEILGVGAFQFSGIEKLDLPNIQYISSSVFTGCESLNEVNLPNVTSIGDGAFKDCKNLKEVNVPNVEVIYEDAFCSQRCGSGLEKIDAPNVNYIGRRAFAECKALKEANFPQVQSIDKEAFCGSGIENINISSSLKEVADDAFKDCPNFKYINGKDISSPQQSRDVSKEVNKTPTHQKSKSKSYEDMDR